LTSRDLLLLLAGLAAGAVLAALVAWLLARARVALAHAAGRASREAEVCSLAARVEAAEALERQLVSSRAELATLRAAQEDALQRERGERAAEAQRDRAQAAEAAQRERAVFQGEMQRESGARRAAESRAAELAARLEEQQQSAVARYKDLEEARERMKLEFQQLAAGILDDKSKRFDETQQQQLGQLLTPLREQLGDFRRVVTDVYEKENNSRVALQTRIDDLVKLNQTLGAEASSLSRALNADNRSQGYWGELKLERLLESAGLEKGAQYLTQESFLDGDGDRYRPDAVLKLPEGRDIVIDAKMVLVDYQRACEACPDDEREQHLTRHAGALRNHVRQLGEKDYGRLVGVNAPDLVLLFVPVEGAFLEALRRDPSLYEFAFSRKIIMVGPSNLLASLRLIAQVWRTDQQNRNARTIADRAAALYDKFVGFADDLARVGEHLEKAVNSHRGAVGKLSQGKGNLIRQAEMLRELGVAPGKRLPAGLIDASGMDEPAPGE
jgi:DNA recombination protein RmuC